MLMGALPGPDRTFPSPAPAIAASVGLRPWIQLAGFAALLALNWLLAATYPSQMFSYTSIGLFAWLLVIVARITPSGAILLLPLIITRAATFISLLAIEAGAYMPEVSRAGTASDASASFMVFTAVMFISFAGTYRALEQPLLAFARSPLLDDVVALLAWPVVAACAFWGLIAAADGMQSGFPLLEGIDRFLYRRDYSSVWVFTLLDNKFLVSALLGAVVFRGGSSRMLRYLATLTLVMLTALYFLFGDKFFTILTEISFFLMPFLLQRQGQLMRTLLLGMPLALALLAGALGATIYIYSDYGRLPADRAMKALGERIAGQGQLWFLATQDNAQPVNFDGGLVSRYVDGLDAADPGRASFENGVETYYFIHHYSPPELVRNFQQNGGSVQLTMGSEAMALVMFGYWGVAIAMIVGGVLVAFAALFLRRTFASGFPLTLFFAVFTYLQIYFVVQQASLWPIAAPGQWKRFLLFAVIELIVAAVNRGQILQAMERYRRHAFHTQALGRG